MTTHWIPIVDGPLQGRIHYAICGLMIPVDVHSETPTCVACQQLKAEHDANLERFLTREGVRSADDPRRI